MSRDKLSVHTSCVLLLLNGNVVYILYAMEADHLQEQTVCCARREHNMTLIFIMIAKKTQTKKIIRVKIKNIKHILNT